MERITTASRLADFHLAASEVACKCCGRLDLALPAAQLHAKLREKLGPIVVASGCRCPRNVAGIIADPNIPTKAGSVLTAAHASILPTDRITMGGKVISRPCTALDPRVPPGMTRPQFAKVVSATAKGLFGEDARIGLDYPMGWPVHYDLFPLVLRLAGMPNPDPVNIAPGVRW